MPSSVHPNNEFLRPTRDMVISSELKKSSKPEKHCNKIVKPRVPSPQASTSPKCQDTLKVESPVGLPYSHLLREQRQDRDGKNSVQVKSSATNQRSFVKVNTSKEDELVKYMSNLPGYLQRAERGENNQDKALNFGVLDWARLEKWNYKQNRIPARGGDNALCRSCDLSSKATNGSSTISSKVHRKMFSERHLPRPNPNSSHKDGHAQDAKLSNLNAVRFHDFESASKSRMDGQQKEPKTYKSYSRNCSDIMLDRGKSKDFGHKITTEMGNSAGSSGTNGISLSHNYDASACDGEAKKSIKELQDSDIKRKDGDKKILSEIRSSHSDRRSHGFSLHSMEKLSAGRGENRKRIEELQKSEVNLFNLCSPGEHTNMLLLPKELAQNKISEVFQLSQPRESKKKSSETLKSSFSDDFSSKDVHSETLCSDVPHSCPLLPEETDPMSDIIPDSLINAQCSNKLSSVASHKSKFPNKASKILPKSIYAERKDLDLKLNNSDVRTAKAADEETAVLETKRVRNPSPNHRFSFSLGRLGRSFSFKEGSSVPQFSFSNASVKSGLMRSESSACLDTSIREKPNVPNRAKSSPLRRLFEPIRRYKVANSLHSAETPQPVKESLDFISSGPSRVCHSIQKEKHETSSIQALLQLRVKNGLPLFKFGVENDRNILAATMKNLMSSGKHDSGRNYTFYTVNEITKKSGGWMSQGSKRDSCGYVYNVIGQMVSNTCFSDLSGPNSHNEYMVRKSVLLGVEPMQEDQEQLKFMPKMELAAVVVKIPFENLSHDGMESHKESMETPCMTCLPEGRCSCNFKENKKADGITVLLPGAVHGPPDRGEPSPLIDRWDGLCDCGGWDVGCKLRVLSNQNRSSKIHVTSEACPIPDNIELFVQEEPQESTPFFRLTPMKDGIYTIEFNSSISFLQSFFICVAILSRNRPMDPPATTKISAVQVFKQPSLNENGGIQRKAPAKYAPSPPLSPVGRV